MYMFEYTGGTYYINVENICSMYVGKYRKNVTDTYGLQYIANENKYTTYIFYVSRSADEFVFDTVEEAEQLATKIANMKAAMFDAKVGK